jgi:hypothetical protein
MSESTPQTTVNVETASVQEPIEVVGGSSPVSWDELSAVDNWRKGLSDEPQVKTAQRRSEEGDDLEEVLETKSEKGEKHGKEKSSKEKASEEKDEVKTTKGKEKEAKETKEAVKALKFKHGDKDLEVAADALVTVKVDGKTVEVPVQEVINRYSQQRHLDDLFRKHKAERQEFETSRAKMNEVVQKSHELLSQKKDLKGFMEFMSETLGVDGQQLYTDALEKIRQAVEEESTLTPEEVRLKRLEEENQYYRSKAEAAKSAQVEAAKVKEMEGKIQEVMSSFEMQKSDFVQAYDDLVKNGFDPNQITPEQVGKYWDNMKLVQTIESKLAEVNPELAGNYDEVEKLANLAIQTDANRAEIEEVINQLYANDSAKKLSKKITKTLKKAHVESGPKRGGSDPLFFDDI